ncbi:MAG: DUF4851 domain-containing protein [Mailhella sp.]|jgi:hypothetical protein|nr:DUF4851 domain-containing protein [Mailhella sp.]
MKRLLAAAFAAAFILLSGCAGSYHRGMDAGGAFVSTVSPEVRVIPAAGFEPVLSGRTSCMAREQDVFMAVVPVHVWYGVSAREGAQLAVLLGECDQGWNWSVSAHGAEHENYLVLREMHGVAARDADVTFFVRPAAADPFLRVHGTDGWEQGVLVAQYVWINSNSKAKLIVEYREPAPASAEELLSMPDVVSAFHDRAAGAFSMAQAGEAPVPGQAAGAVPPDSLLSPVLGALEPLSTFSVF